MYVRPLKGLNIHLYADDAQIHFIIRIVELKHNRVADIKPG